MDGQPLRVVAVPFPTRAPELNPIELNWNTFVMRLKGEKVDYLNAGGGAESMKQ